MSCEPAAVCEVAPVCNEVPSVCEPICKPVCVKEEGYGRWAWIIVAIVVVLIILALLWWWWYCDDDCNTSCYDKKKCSTKKCDTRYDHDY